MDINYSIYPTLLDSFFWYKKIPTDEKLKELLDKINRVKYPIPIAALKGIQFEDCVNKYIKKIPLNKDFSNKKTGEIITDNFRFDAEIIDKIGNKLSRAIEQQKYIQAIVPTEVGNVKFYGFVDYTFPEMFVDLKTTSNYKIGKFKVNNQHKCYSLISDVNGTPIKQFNYVVTDFSRMFIETYDCTDKLHTELLNELYDFVDFLENHKHLITDNKIFGK